jgi:hypothetical protein
MRPNAVSLTSPADNATDVGLNPTFTWQAATGATSYLLEVSEQSDFATLVYSVTTPATTHKIASSIPDGRTLYWRVTATNPCGDGASSAVYSFSTILACAPAESAQTLVSYDFEQGEQGFTHTSLTGPDTWVLTNTMSANGSYAWYAEDWADRSDQVLASPAYTLPATGGDVNSLLLRFNNFQAFEAPDATGCWDGGVLEVSTDSGTTWSYVSGDKMLTDPYDDTFWDNTPGNNPIEEAYSFNPAAWCDPAQDWLTSLVDITDYAGETVQFRWRMGTDNFVGAEGWYIRDVQMDACVAQVAGVVVDGDTAVSAEPGTTANYAVTITNTGNVAEPFNISVSGAWSASSNVTETAVLGVGETETVTVTVSVPLTATDGLTDTTTVTAVSQFDDQVSASHDMTTTAVVPNTAGVVIDGDTAATAIPGSSASYTVTVTNTGTTTDTFDLLVMGDWSATSGVTQTMALSVGEAQTFVVEVTVPVTATNGMMDTTTVTAVSQFDGQVSASHEMTTTAVVIEDVYAIYLPLVIRP